MTDYDKDQVLHVLDELILTAEEARSKVSRGDGRHSEVRFVNDLYPVDYPTDVTLTICDTLGMAEALSRRFGLTYTQIHDLEDRAYEEEDEALQR